MTKLIKIKLFTSSKIFEEEVLGFINKENKTISYVEKDQAKTFVEFDYLHNILKRDNNSIYLEYHFNTKNKSYILEKESNQRVKLNLKNIKILNNKRYIGIEYSLNNEFYKYEILLDIKS